MRLQDDTSSYFDPAGLRLIALLWSWRKFLAVNVLVVMVLTAGVSLLLPNLYRAESSIMPPSEDSSMLPRGAADLLMGLGPVGFMAQGLQSSGSQHLAVVLRSRSLADIVIARENLIEHYDVDKLPDARRQFDDNLAVSVDADGLVQVKMADRDPEKAADIVATALWALDSINQSLSTSSAAATRRFVDSRLGEVEQELRAAEDELRRFQEERGTIAIEEQLAVLIQNLALLRVERMQSEMDYALLEEQLGPEHKRLLGARQKIEGLDRQIAAVASTGDSAASLTAGNAPSLAMQSVRLYRQVTVYDQLYTFLRQALEQAKIDERRDTPTFSVLDGPVPPDRKWRPKRSFIVLGSAATAFAILLLLIVWSESTGTSREIPGVGYATGWRRLVRRPTEPVN